MPTAKTTAEKTISRRIPRTLDATLHQLAETIRTAPPSGLPLPSPADLLAAAALAGIDKVRAAYGLPAKKNRHA